jgi:hypothetical protein
MSTRAVFLNAPYDKSFEPLFLAYLVGITGFGLVPRATIQIQGSGHRITCILELIHSCEYSIHDLSRVELSPPPDSVPKFNMPFELGLAYHHSLSGNHTCFIFESEYKRFERSLGDLKGVDIYQHKSNVEKLFSELTGALVKENLMPSVRDMLAVYILTTETFPSFCSDAGTETLFHSRVFDDVLYFLRKIWADRQVKTRSNQL